MDPLVTVIVSVVVVWTLSGIVTVGMLNGVRLLVLSAARGAEQEAPMSEQSSTRHTRTS